MRRDAAALRRRAGALLALASGIAEAEAGGQGSPVVPPTWGCWLTLPGAMRSNTCAPPCEHGGECTHSHG
jgi:hypothetical protein